MSERQYVVFKLDKLEFGIEIMNIEEVVNYQDPTLLPNSPDFMEGVINYRDKVIPIINLKKRLLLGEENYKNDDTRIIIIDLDGKEVGFLVDGVSQTIRLANNEIEEAPELISTVDRRYIEGIGKLGEERLLILIDLNNILSIREIEELKTVNE